MNLIQCSCIVNGHKEAQELVIDLNAMKSSDSEDFYIQYDRNQDYSQNNNYLIIGNVRVMNVWGVRTGTDVSNYTFSDPKQDMLCLVTDFIIVPEPSLTLAGLLCGVILLNVKRKQYKTTNI